MLINLSNHLAEKWDVKQKKAANQQFGEIIDMSFPDISPHWNKQEVDELVAKYYADVLTMLDRYEDEIKENAVHIQGEFTFVYMLVKALEAISVKCVASTTSRNVSELHNGEKVVKFKFIQFREY